MVNKVKRGLDLLKSDKRQERSISRWFNNSHIAHIGNVKQVTYSVNSSTTVLGGEVLLDGGEGGTSTLSEGLDGRCGLIGVSHCFLLNGGY